MGGPLAPEGAGGPVVMYYPMSSYTACCAPLRLFPSLPTMRSTICGPIRIRYLSGPPGVPFLSMCTIIVAVLFTGALFFLGPVAAFFGGS